MAAKVQNADLDFLGTGRLQNLAAATAAGQAVRYEEFNAALQGLAWKDDVAAASTANINLAAPGATIDGVTMSGTAAMNYRFLAKDQTTASENGVYTWNGASSPATRAPDMDASAEFNAAVVPVDPGGTTNGGSRWRSTVANPTLGTTAIAFTSDQTTAPAASTTTAGVVRLATQAETDAGTDNTIAVTPGDLANYAGKAKRYTTTVGDGSSTSINVTHNLGSTHVNPFIREATGNKRPVDCEIRNTDANTLTLVFNTAPASNAYDVTVLA